MYHIILCLSIPKNKKSGKSFPDFPCMPLNAAKQIITSERPGCNPALRYFMYEAPFIFDKVGYFTSAAG